MKLIAISRAELDSLEADMDSHLGYPEKATPIGGGSHHAIQPVFAYGAPGWSSHRTAGAVDAKGTLVPEYAEKATHDLALKGRIMAAPLAGLATEEDP